jgi:hypothetical protein
MLTIYKIENIIKEIQKETGVYYEFKIVKMTQASTVLDGELLQKGNCGVKFGRKSKTDKTEILYILQEKMTTPGRCIFNICQKTCRKFIVPRSKAVNFFVDKAVDDFYHLKNIKDEFVGMLYETMSNYWLLDMSTISYEMKNRYIKYAGRFYNPHNLKLGKKNNRKLANQWELHYRLNTLLLEKIRSLPTSEKSVETLELSQKKLVIELESSIEKTTRNILGEVKKSLELYDELYGLLPTSTAKKEVSEEVKKEEGKKEENITWLDVDVFRARCKVKGIDDKAIEEYLLKLRKLPNVKFSPDDVKQATKKIEV